MNDLRYAFRALWKDPGFTIPAVLALALSIGANTSVFTVVKSVLLEPLPMKQPDQLMAVYQIRPDGQRFPFNIPIYLDVRERSRAFQEVSDQGFWNANLTGEANPERLLGVRATGNFFPLVSMAQASGDLDRVARDLRRDYPAAAAGMVSIAPVSMRQDLTGPSQATLTTLMAAVALVLLIACANVSSLLVAKASGRQREMAI